MPDNNNQPFNGPAHIMAISQNDPQLQALIPDPAIEAAIKNPELAYWQVIETALTGYADRPAMGERAYAVRNTADANTKPRHQRELQAAFNTITYGEFQRRIKGIAAAWQTDPRLRVNPGEFVCVLGFAGIDYATLDLACEYVQAVTVPLQASLATVNLDGIFATTEPTAVAATIADASIAAELVSRHSSIRSLIIFDYDPRVDEERERFEAVQAMLAPLSERVTVITLNTLVAVGADSQWQPPATASNQRMVVLMHSSGSTGSPKGVMLTEVSVRSLWNPVPPKLPVVRIVFAPMNHIGGRTMLYSVLARGGSAFFTAQPDLSELFNDIRIARPTEIVFFPRVLEMIHQHYLSEMVRRMGAGEERELASANTMAVMRESFLGNRVGIYSVGSAPTTPEIKQFMQACFQVPLLEGYGSTETGVPVTKLNQIQRPPVIDYRLRDVPELGYYTTDLPYPRGELCIKSLHSTTGYYQRPDLNAALFDADGFLCTGDIMEERGPDHVVYIDRRNDVLKLSQGEFVAVGALGNTFENGSDLIEQIYVYGNSARAYLLAVVVPNAELVASRLGSNPDSAALHKLIRAELNTVANSAGLKAFEVPRAFIIETEPFSREKGLLSNMFKRMRPALQARYGDRLEQIYSDLERKQNEELMALQAGHSDLPVEAKVARILEATLGIDNVDASQAQTFAALGGDSLDATTFSVMLERVFGVTIPAGTILSPASNLHQWTMAVETALRNDGDQLASFEQVHGKGATRLQDTHLELEAFIDAQVLDAAPTELPPAQSTTVLLTGATGFLGRFLCIEWLERVARVNGTLICLIRAADQQTAEQRLHAAFAGKDPQLAERFATLARQHLQIVVGDVASCRLGLDQAGFDELAQRVDHIVHPAALVNHILPYQDLFGPNVAGTAELARLALSRRMKRIDFVSTVGVIQFLEPGVDADETTPLVKAVDISSQYGNGYSASKWASEQLLQRLHQRFKVPVNIFRGDMMLAHRQAAGHINAQDVFTRLLYSVIQTGLAPASFYPRNADGSRAAAHYDGLPVDFIAAAIAGTGAAAHNHLRTYHVFNHHEDDGVSLDVIIDWVEAEGYPIERIADYASWLEQFAARLQALPREKKQASSLNVLGALRRQATATPHLPGSAQFIAAVQDLPAGPDVPHLTREFIAKCLRDMQLRGMIAPATGR